MRVHVVQCHEKGMQTGCVYQGAMEQAHESMQVLIQIKVVPCMRHALPQRRGEGGVPQACHALHSLAPSTMRWRGSSSWHSTCLKPACAMASSRG